MACAACIPLAAAQPAYRMESYVTLNGKTQPAFAWCDAPDRVLALTDPGSPRPTSISQSTTLVRWTKAAPAQVQSRPFLLGPGDGAAGSIFVALNPAGRPAPAGPQQGGYVRLSNVENVLDPSYRLSRVGEVKVGADVFRCRYVPDAVFLGVTAKRTVILWESGGKITYATRNFDGTPGVYLTGGTRAQDDIGPEYTFQKAGYTYLLKFHPYAAFVQVKQGAGLLQTEPFLAYSISTPLR